MDDMEKAISEMTPEEYEAFCDTLPFAMVDFRNVNLETDNDN
jgi:hypothetical protein